MPISSVLGSSALLPAGLGFRNKIINGDFRINQRSFSSSVNPDNVFCFDRWNMYAFNGTSTYTSQPFTLGNTIEGQEPLQYLRVVTSGQTTTNAATTVSQKIEDVRTCAGQQIVISFWAKCGTAGKKIGVELVQDFGTGGSPSSSVITFVNQATLSTSWTRYVLTVVVPSISGKTLGSNNNSFLALGFWISAGSGFNSRSGSLGIQSDTFEIWGVQLEQNTQPTPFEQRPIGVELALCQRYYWRINGNASAYARISSCGSTYSGTSWQGWVLHPTPMRIAATSIDWSGIGVTDNVGYDSTSFVTLNLNVNNGTPITAFLSGAGASSINANGAGHILILRGNASSYIGFNAEL